MQIVEGGNVVEVVVGRPPTPRPRGGRGADIEGVEAPRFVRRLEGARPEEVIRLVVRLSGKWRRSRVVARVVAAEGCRNVVAAEGGQVVAYEAPGVGR